MQLNDRLKSNFLYFIVYLLTLDHYKSLYKRNIRCQILLMLHVHIYD